MLVAAVKVKFDNKTWDLPSTLIFERDGTESRTSRFFYKVIGFRAPKKGEWFVSGAIPYAYRAINDLSTKFLIAEKTYHAIKDNSWKRGDCA
jgi:hypothetical protein